MRQRRFRRDRLCTVLNTRRESGHDGRMVGIVRRAYGVLGLCGGAFGVAGWQDDARTWAEWAAVNPELAGALMGAGGVMFATWVVWEAIRLWRHGILGLKARARKPERSQSPTATVIGYEDAMTIIGRYIDPQQTMRSGVKIAVRADIFDKFNGVVGAKIGEGYNGELLRDWIEGNAGKILVKHRGEMR